MADTTLAQDETAETSDVDAAIAAALATQTPAPTATAPVVETADQISAARASVALALAPLGRLSATYPFMPALLAGINAAFHAYANSVYGVIDPVPEASRDETAASVTADGPVLQGLGASALNPAPSTDVSATPVPASTPALDALMNGDPIPQSETPVA